MCSKARRDYPRTNSLCTFHFLLMDQLGQTFNQFDQFSLGHMSSWSRTWHWPAKASQHFIATSALAPAYHERIVGNALSKFSLFILSRVGAQNSRNMETLISTHYDTEMAVPGSFMVLESQGEWAPLMEHSWKHEACQQKEYDNSAL